MRQYADAAALAAYPGGDTIAADDADALLRTASRVVDEALGGVVYATDATSKLPTDPDVAQALSDAACAIAVEAMATGVTKAGATMGWQSVGIGNVSLSGRKATEGTLWLLGWPIPAAAVAALRSVGTVQWNTATTYRRPLDRVAR